MSTAPTTCPRSPRTEKRISEKLRRREMTMNGDIADKLYRPDLMTLDLSFNNRPDVSPINSSPEKNSNGKHREKTEDGFNKNRIEAALGSYADFKQLRNFQRMQGISSLQSPTCTPSPTCTANKDKRKMPGSSLARDRDPIATDTSSSSSHVINKSTDLRDKINKSRRSCEVPRGGQVTHRSLKERIEKGGGENLIEFTKLPGSKGKTEESGDERKVKQDKRKYHNSSSAERRRSSSDRRDSSETRHLSGERKRSSQDQRRKSDHVRHRDRKRPHTTGSGLDSDMDSDSTLSTGDIFRLTNIFNVMRCNGAGEMSPLPHSHKKTASSSQSRLSSSRSVKEEVESDSDEEELDLEKLKAKMMDDSILPSSPAVKLKGKLMDESSSTVKLKPKVIEPLVPAAAGDLSGSDIDSDQDCDEFPLSKSVMEMEVKEEPLSDPEPRFKFDTSNVKLEDQKPKVKVEEKPMVKQEEKPKVKLEEKPAVNAEESVKIKPERTEKEAVKACAAAAAFTLPTPETLEVEKREQKPFVAVNPRMKNASLCEDEGSGAMGEMLRNIRETPVTDENLVDIRRLLASGAQFNLLLSFGFDKLSTRSLTHPDLISSVKSYRSKRGESESSNEEEGKPVEKPSCKVPCIPRADHVTKVPCMPRAEHVARGQHEVKRESVSPDRDQSPDQVYHRDKREYGYPPKRRRITREPPEYDTFQHSAYLNLPNGIHTIAAIPSLAYLVQQPRNLLPPTRTQCTFMSRNQQDIEKTDLDKALKGLLKFEVYYKKGHALKKEADNLTHNQTLKIKKYMEASIQYVYAALSAQQKQDFKSCYVWLHDTANIIDFCLRLRSNNGLDVRIQDKRLAVLCLLLVSHIQRTIWTNRRTEYLNLQKSCNHIIRQKQKEVQNRSSSQTNNTSMKSGDSPTPSPAGSLMSMASYTGTEVLDTNMLSNTDTVPARLIKDISKYFKLAQALNCWVENWEEAGTLAQHSLEFFNNLDDQVCPINSTTHLFIVARYVGQGLENLNKEAP